MMEKLLRSLGIIVLLAGASQRSNAQVPTVWFVDRDYTGAETGTSWQTPFSTIEAAIDQADGTLSAPPYDQIWIKMGTYTPDNASIGFLLKPRVHVYGGFYGNEVPVADFENNDPRQFDADGYLVHETILSGELGDPDDYSDNVKVVVTAPAFGDDFILDGFTIRRANGHGILNLNTGSAIYRNLLITQNRCIDSTLPTGYAGAGMHVYGSSITIANCRFTENILDILDNNWLGGGAALGLHEGNATVRGCAFRNNLASDDDAMEFEGGGAIWARKGAPTIRDSVFENNHCIQGPGGAVCIRVVPSEHNAVIAACHFYGNQVTYKGGFLSATIGGGGAFLDGGPDGISILSCVFLDNKVIDDSDLPYGRGGAILLDAGGAVVNSLFASNQAESGAGIGIMDEFTPSGHALTINACTIVRNQASDEGGGAFIPSQSVPNTYVRNCIVWENEASCATTCTDDEEAQIKAGSSSAVIVTYSDIQNLTANGPFDDGTNNIQNFNADPLFIDPDNDNYRLRRCSPAIDRADTTPFHRTCSIWTSI